jgi:hypothetical protein
MINLYNPILLLNLNDRNWKCALPPCLVFAMHIIFYPSHTFPIGSMIGTTCCPKNYIHNFFWSIVKNNIIPTKPNSKLIQMLLLVVSYPIYLYFYDPLIHYSDIQDINIINCHIIHQLIHQHYIICHIILHSKKFQND